ncbi:dUTP diphosphatase [Gottfriedia acidiceleris]|uniref:dUTP diphosphatase n=1 Tax=Gottfriedia acidiceleris TaxID=371036 RepID=UPI003398704D
MKIITLDHPPSLKLRGFEILDEFKEHFENGSVKKPTRATEGSAGYDISAVGDYIIPAGTKRAIDTGLTAYMGPHEWLALFVRSGHAYSKNLTLQNAVGVIDSDYYGKHIRVLLRNEGTEPFVVKHGDRIGQGIFLPFLKVDDDYAHIPTKRESGFGSTGVKVA